MDYLKIGNHLRLTRERKGLSYEQIFEVTRIQPSVLKGIEEGKSSVSPILLKGFIKSYAKALGLDSEKLFLKNKEPDQQTKDTNKELKEEKDKAENKKQNYIKYILAFLGFLVVIQLIGFVIRGSKKTAEEELVLEEDKKSQLEEKNKERKNQKQKSNQELKETGVAEIQNADLVNQETSLFHQIKNSAFKEELLIKSSESLEIYFKVDKKSTITKTLKASVWFKIKAKESIYLRFDDNQGDVQVFYNGVQLDMNNTFFFEKTFSKNN